MPVTVPCGKCVGCRLSRSKEWAIRCVKEASMHEKNCFITLTYNDENLPDGATLVKKDFQNFMKRLRKEHGEGIKYFHCGEYGTKNQRPHYHACLFNFDFMDKKLRNELKNYGKHNIYTSDNLERLWPFGFSMIGDVTYESAAYVARYMLKKAYYHNGQMHNVRQELMRKEREDGRQKEYLLMSRRPAVGKIWYEKYKNEVYPLDRIVHRGLELRPPKYYDSLYDLDNHKEFVKIKAKRRKAMEENKEDYTQEALATKEKILIAKTKNLKRSIEE